MSNVDPVTGQPGPAETAEPVTGTTASAPKATETGQSASDAGTGTTAQAEGGTQKPVEDEGFFDPRSIQDKPELMAAYKQMQKAWTQKTQSLKADKQKLDAYNAFMSDPHGELKRMAQALGYDLRHPGQQQNQQPGADEWQPQTWDDVLKKAEERAYERVTRELGPHVNDLRRQNLERYLDDNAPDWRQYEDQMVQLMGEHPTLAKDPLKLYRLCVPDEVLERRATQHALSRVTKNANSARAATGTASTARQPLAEMPQPKSIQEAWEQARQKVAAQGIAAPPGNR